MGFKDLFRRLISEDSSGAVQDLESSGSYRLHREIIERKPLLKEIYAFYFDELLGPLEPTEGKRILELGAGAYSCSVRDPGLITSNSGLNDYIKVVVDAQHIPFRDSSLDGITMLNTMHHIPRARLFFDEALRTLKPGGLVTMIEPYLSPLGWLVYKLLHHEPVLKTTLRWEVPGGLVSNQAMPYHIFTRDRALFEREYPDLRIEKVEAHTCMTHLVSGGLSYKALVPDSMRGLVWKAEGWLKPLRPLLALYMTVVLRKV